MPTERQSDRPARLLCVGDVHLGLPPKRLPAGLVEFGLSARELGPAAALGRAVELALNLEVDAVLLAGDVVESDNELFEAYAPLRACARRLADGGIPLLAVAGNHDTRALPRLARELPSVQLVGRDGVWEALLVERGGQPRARVLGWSFPRPKVTESPLLDFPAAWREGRFDDDAAGEHLPTLGLLHCELEASGGHHAPVRLAELRSTGFAFALGHVHQPAALQGPRPIGYLGCLSGVDPGEPGPRGPWLFESTHEGWRCEQFPIAPLRYERVALEVDGLEDLEALRDRWLALQARTAQSLADACRSDPFLETHPLRAAALRLVFRGSRSARLARAALETLGREELEAPPRELDGVVLFVEAWQDETRAELEIEQLARGDDPAGLLAQRVLQLESPSAERNELLERARRDLALALAPYQLPEQHLPDKDDELAALLAGSARRLLENLLAPQRELAG